MRKVLAGRASGTSTDMPENRMLEAAITSMPRVRALFTSDSSRFYLYRLLAFSSMP
jgi:hypothetical protein